jgi:hypothetical protein
MKSIKICLWLLITLVVVSCTQEDGALYDTSNNRTLVSLAASKYNAELAPADGDELIVNLHRANTKGAVDVPCSFKSSSTLFTMSDTVAHFADGAAIAKLTISFPGSAQMDVSASCKLTVSVVDSAMLSPGGVAKQTLELKRRLTWVDAGKGKWTDGLVTSIFNTPVVTCEVNIQKAEEVENIYRMVNPYGYNVYEYTETKEDMVAETSYVMINAIDADKVFIPSTGIGIDFGYGEIFVSSLSGKYGKRSGKTITFPAETLAVGMRNYKEGSLAFLAEECVLVLP